MLLLIKRDETDRLRSVSLKNQTGVCECSDFTIIFYGIRKKVGEKTKFRIHF